MKNATFLKATFVALTFLFSQQISANNITDKIDNSSSPSIFDEMNYQELLEINLEMNMKNLFENRRIDQVIPAQLSFKDKYGKTQDWDVKVSQRGKFRRLKCEKLPPIRLDFKKEDLKNAGLEEFDDLKLVTHCMNNPKKAKQLLVREYLAYKIYNELTPKSFRVQFVKLNFKDRATGDVEEQYGILIEDTAQLRARLSVGKVDEVFNLSPEKFNHSQVKVVALFNYMIGNSDWSINLLRNVKLLSKDDKYILVPYDFDFSGLVDAPYVRLKKELGISSVRERVFLGFDDYLGDMNSTMRYFRKKRSVILQMIKDCSFLEKKDRREVTRYIQSFYDGGQL